MKRAWLVSAFLFTAAGCREVPVAVREIKPTPPKTTRNFAVPVLMYHRVCDLTPSEQKSPLSRDLTVSPADFEDQVRYLSENGFTFLLAGDVEEALREGRELPEKAVAITLDDGYQDNFTNAFPILRKYGAKATIFVVTNNIGRPARLTWRDMLEMAPAGVGYGSHSITHPDLTSLGLDALRFELRESKRILESRLPEQITSIAYPAGRYDDTVVVEARSAGYLAAWKKGGGPVEPSHAGEPFLLPRVRVHGKTSMQDFHRKVWSGRVVQRLRRAGRLPS